MNERNTYLIVDISGKVLNYDYALCEALAEEGEGEVQVILAAHVHDKKKFSGCRLRLLSFVPSSQQISTGRLKRVVKAVEGVVNYAIVLTYVAVKRPSVIHFQWFPYMEFTSVEIPFVRLLRWCSKKSKVILTIHNVFPHGASQQQREQYRQRLVKMDPLIDRYVVHTESTAEEAGRIFGISKSRVTVVPHGIFSPDYQPHSGNAKPSGDKQTIILYGINRRNKGADILVDAVRRLPKEYQQRVRVLMAGKTSAEYLQELKEIGAGIDIEFHPTFIPDQDLFRMIDDADFIALPYREISQSGVLLLALYFRKPLLVSDLPSFRETLRGFTPDMFFEAGSAESMSELMIRIFSGKIDIGKEREAIGLLNKEYSWENSARKTLAIYKRTAST